MGTDKEIELKIFFLSTLHLQTSDKQKSYLYSIFSQALIVLTCVTTLIITLIAEFIVS